MPTPDPAGPAPTEKVLFITYSYDDPDEASVLDVSPNLETAAKYMRGQFGFCYRVERQPDGSYGNEQFITVFNPETVAPVHRRRRR